MACTGHGLCAELFPEQLTLDEWSYPVQAPGPFPADQLRHARRAVAACPALALRLETSRSREPDPTTAPRTSSSRDLPRPHPAN
ncbi:ferredoxin [Actinospica durhamensis]|uniref:Ferredoxin n=1 Tax=Actinospica durhamensis TaxID=1508375 RepID=A0A941EWY8_9ACTN|nr:ferredoxin [Actinospica durhamensis]